MELKHQVCSVHVANELAGLIKLDTYYSYILMDGGDLDNARLIKKSMYERMYSETEYIPCPAPTVAEFGIVLQKVMDGHPKFVIKIDPAIIGVIEIKRHFRDGTYKVERIISEETEADARGECLIWFISKKHVKVEDLKL